MAVLVSFLDPASIGNDAVLSVGKPRKFESVAVGSSTSNSASDGEWALVLSTEVDVIKGASGSTPDATAATATGATSAAFPIPPNQYVPVQMNADDKLNFAALS